MSTTEYDHGRGSGPAMVVTAEELFRLYRRLLEDEAANTRAYTQTFTWKKTDFSITLDGVNSVSRPILAGDVEAIGGWIVAETTGVGVAAFRLHDGNSATGESLGRINLAANESTRDFVPLKGIEVYTGRVFLEVIGGSVEGVLIWR